MEYLILPGTDLRVSRVGFGSSHLMGRLKRSESHRLLETAFDAGITHFDTARLYGYGEAESVVGDFMRGKRDRVTAATKIGINPPNQSALLDIVKATIRPVCAMIPRLRQSVRHRAQNLIQRGCFDLPGVRRSLEASFRHLRTDYLDILLLHECATEDLTRPELLEFLKKLQREGKIRHFGIASSIEVVVQALQSASDYCGIVQFASDAWNDNASLIREVATTAVITHSPIRSRLRAFERQLAEDPRLASAWSSRLGIDVLKRGALGSLLIKYAVRSNTQGVVLFSSVSENNIKTNAIAANCKDFNFPAIHELVRYLQAGAASGRLVRKDDELRQSAVIGK